MDVSSIGPSGLDPFTPVGPPPEDPRDREPERPEPAPLPEGSGDLVDTSA